MVAGSIPAGRASPHPDFRQDNFPTSHYVFRVSHGASRLLPILLAAVVSTPTLPAVDPAALEALRAGDYEKAAQLSAGEANQDARAMEITLRTMLATGRYEEAAQLARQAIRRFPSDSELLVACADALLSVGDGALAVNALMMAARTQEGGYNPDAETPAAAAARAFALQQLGADPRLVVERILTEATKQSPDAIEPYLTLAEIALSKRDNLFASETLREAMRRFPENADVRFGMARALADPKLVAKYLDETLERNPRHVPALVFKAEWLTDLDDFVGAQEALNSALAINPSSPAAWAQQALLCRLHGNEAGAEKARARALQPWPQNPEVDYRIGTGLGRNYRFAEAIESLRTAIAMDPMHLPSHFELGSNLLRFGEEKTGWNHIERVHLRDPYHVAAFNLMTLKATMQSMTTLSRGGVNVRMPRLDREVYGQRALDLAAKARKTFIEKYDAKLPFSVTVDVLPTENDFAVRTFSLPVGEGFLAVCFGPLITTCSPRGRTGQANWEAVLWHEMAHTITLTATRHRIPRWLSEGISVHEENLVDNGWGMHMDSKRRRAILDGRVPPMLQLDELFRRNTDLAYFSSALAVEFLEDKVGVDGMRKILNHLAGDMPVGKAIASVAGPMDTIEKDFAEYLREKAEAYCPGIDWALLSDEEFQSLRANPDAFLAAQPNRYFAVMDRANQLARSGNWQGVRELLSPLIAQAPDIRESEGPYALLAQAQRRLGDHAAERALLEKWLALDAGVQPAAERLVELARDSGDPAFTERAANALLAINPFDQNALLALGRSQLREGRTADAIASYEALLSMKPIRSSRLRYELAEGLRKHHHSDARRQVLLALEENPRFEEALDLLQEINGVSR